MRVSLGISALGSVSVRSVIRIQGLVVEIAFKENGVSCVISPAPKTAGEIPAKRRTVHATPARKEHGT